MKLKLRLASLSVASVLGAAEFPAADNGVITLDRRAGRLHGRDVHELRVRRRRAAPLTAGSELWYTHVQFALGDEGDSKRKN